MSAPDLAARANALYTAAPATAAEEKAATENEIRAAVRIGTTPLDAYERYGTF